MKIFDRAREIILHSRQTWQIISEEKSSIKDLFINYAAPLAVIPAVSALIGMTLVGMRMPAGNLARAPFIEALLGAAIGFVIQLVAVFVGAWAVKMLAPFFGSKPDLTAAVKLIVYSMTPVWLVGIFQLVPGLGILSLLGLYGVYLLILGLGPVMGTPSNKIVWYAISIFLLAIIINFILSIIVVGLVYGPMYMRMLAI
ncbi:MAG: YIP1 family protein [Candidatus Saganbacteria bacterium]|nr:YIP1 family protein [Candidatus Saganbacteria bacterium]